VKGYFNNQLEMGPDPAVNKRPLKNLMFLGEIFQTETIKG